MKLKCRKLSLFWKTISLMSTVVFLSVSFIGVSTTLKYRDSTVGDMKHTVKTIGDMGNIVIPIEELKQVINKEVSWDNINNTLTKIVNNTDCMYAYILYKDGNDFVYVADGSEEQEDFWALCEYDIEVLHEVWNTGKEYISEDFEYYETDGLYIITTYYDLRDDNGNIVGILGIDLDGTAYKKQIENTWVWTTALCIACASMANIAAILFSMHLVKNTKMLARKVNDINESNGDLTQKTNIKSGDEIEILGESLNELFEYLRAIIITIKSNTVELNNTTDTLDRLVNKQSDEISGNAAIMEELSASYEEISASLTQITENVNNATNESDELLDESNKKCELASDIINRVRAKGTEIERDREKTLNETKTMTDEVSASLEESKAVYKIDALTKAILEIANQTNLLALNASIEAARAGDAGRGFSVVASEIQKLAENCSKTATDIQGVTTIVIKSVDKLMSETNKMIEFMSNTTAETYESLNKLSNNYSDDATTFYNTFEQIKALMTSFKNNMSDINSAVQSVSLAVNENSSGMTSITDTMSNMQTEVQEIVNVMNTNLEIVNNVEKELNKFKVE